MRSEIERSIKHILYLAGRGAATVWPVLAYARAGGLCEQPFPGVKQALLVRSFSFVTFLLDKQKKSKDGLCE